MALTKASKASEAAVGFALGACPLGTVLVAASGEGVCTIALGDDPEALVRDLRGRFPHARAAEASGEFARMMAAVVRFIAAPARGLDLPLDLRGTDFEQRVWAALRQIPAGSTASYGEIAERIGAPATAQEVAAACAANPVAVAVPCHRVVRKSGALAGYRWGVKRKRALLALERAV